MNHGDDIYHDLPILFNRIMLMYTYTVFGMTSVAMNYKLEHNKGSILQSKVGDDTDASKADADDKSTSYGFFW